MVVSLRASQPGLEIVDRARRKKGWTKTATRWCDTANTSPATLKRFWRGLPIQQDVFIGICKAVGIENWQEIVDQSPTRQKEATVEFFAYDEAWVGRQQLIADLKDKVEGSCRVLILTGITGIGKTAMAERLAVELHQDWLQGDWTKFGQENFDNEDQPSDFGNVAARWLKKWGEPVTPEDRKDTQQLLNQLVRRLQEERYLVLMDSLENILKGNEDEGWSDFSDEWWVRFFQSLLAAESCQSRLVLTSQDLPAQIATVGTRYQNFWYYQPLNGLEEPERLALFEKYGLLVEAESPGRPYLIRIGAAYEGHPLALRVIAGEIGSKPFDGNVLAYWNKYGQEVEEVEKAIAEAQTKGVTASADDQWQLDRYTRELRRNVRVRLERTFGRLEKDVLNAYRLLCAASVYRCPVPEGFG